MVRTSLLIWLLWMPWVAGAEAHYATFFSYEGRPWHPYQTHTFATFTEIQIQGNLPARVDSHDISWLPASFVERGGITPVLRVQGRNYSLRDTLAIAQSQGLTVEHLGPYPISRRTFERALARIAYLESGAVYYKAVDVLRRKPALQDQEGASVNCIHAVSDIAGYVGSRTRHGSSATIQVVEAFANAGLLKSLKADEEVLRLIWARLQDPH